MSKTRTHRHIRAPRRHAATAPANLPVLFASLGLALVACDDATEACAGETCAFGATGGTGQAGTGGSAGFAGTGAIGGTSGTAGTGASGGESGAGTGGGGAGGAGTGGAGSGGLGGSSGGIGGTGGTSGGVGGAGAGGAGTGGSSAGMGGTAGTGTGGAGGGGTGGSGAAGGMGGGGMGGGGTGGAGGSGGAAGTGGTAGTGGSGGETRLKVASWNLEWLADEPGQGTVPRAEEDYARLKKYADRLDADVVALQEVEGVAGVSRVFDPNVYNIYVTDDSWVQRTGYAYKKTLKASIEPDFEELSLGGSLRSGAILRVDTSSASLRFMCVHLKASCPSGPLDATSDCETLAEQVPILESWIDEQASGTTPFIVLGDFNRRFFATQNEVIWTEIDDSMPANADLWSATEGQEVDCWGGFTDYIDHIVHDLRARAWSTPDSFAQQPFDASDSQFEDVLSDHCPISAEIVVPGS